MSIPSDVPIANGKRHRIMRKHVMKREKDTMTPSPKNVAAPGLPKASTKFRSEWLRTMLAAIALALVTTAPAPAGTYRSGWECEIFPDSVECTMWEKGPLESNKQDDQQAKY
ncbi:MAG: hypothetical protein E5X58_25895 [Mesorhizobium sp.]|nr:MAG: hypothetical protein E5X58_25895 [Mesorhizobium sp.]